MIDRAIAPTIYFLKAIAPTMSIQPESNRIVTQIAMKLNPKFLV